MSKILTYIAVNLDCKLFTIGEHSTDPTLNNTKCKASTKIDRITVIQNQTVPEVRSRPYSFPCFCAVSHILKRVRWFRTEDCNMQENNRIQFSLNVVIL